MNTLHRLNPGDNTGGTGDIQAFSSLGDPLRSLLLVTTWLKLHLLPADVVSGMGRRAHRANLTEVIPQIASLIALLVLLPTGRYLLSAASALFIWMIGLTILGLIALVTFRRFAAPSFQRPLSNSPLPRNPKLPPPIPAARARPETGGEILQRLRQIDWYQFEKIVAIAYRKTGAQVERRGGANPDGGIDMVLINQAGERTAIQCKHWKTWDVGVKPVRELLGALKDAGIQKGIFIALGGYTNEAKQLAARHGIELANVNGLAELLASSDARFDPEFLELINSTRKLCPKCDHELVIRTAAKGRNPGSQFWGCSEYPRCTFTMPLS